MKTPNNHIFRLIQSMLASEKRYFKMHFASDNSLMTELFDFLNLQKKYDEKEVKEYFKETKMAKNLKVYKVQLMDLVLKSLVTYRHKKTIEDKIRVGIDEVIILKEKQLYDIAYDKLKRLKKLAKQQEQYTYCQQLLNMELDLSLYYTSLDRMSILQEFSFNSKRIANVNLLRIVNEQFLQLNSSDFFEPIDEKKSQQLSEQVEHINQLEQTDFGFIEKAYFSNIQNQYLYLIEREEEKALQNYQQLLKQFAGQKNKERRILYSALYWESAYRYVKLCVGSNKFSEAKKMIGELKAFLEESASISYYQSYLLALEIKVSFLELNFEDFFIREKAYLKTLIIPEQEYTNSAISGFIYLFLAHLAQENHQQAHFYLRRLHANSRKLPEVYSQFFDLLELISHREVKGGLIIQNLLVAFKRKQYGKLGATPFFKKLMQLFQQIVKGGEVKKKVINLEQQLDDFADDGVYLLFKQFKLLDWLEAVKKQKSYAAQSMSKS